jgi:hypothetical protein
LLTIDTSTPAANVLLTQHRGLWRLWSQADAPLLGLEVQPRLRGQRFEALLLGKLGPGNEINEINGLGLRFGLSDADGWPTVRIEQDGQRFACGG